MLRDNFKLYDVLLILAGFLLGMVVTAIFMEYTHRSSRHSHEDETIKTLLQTEQELDHMGESVESVLEIYREYDLSTENKIKIKALKKYLDANTEKKIELGNSSIKFSSVFVNLKIPVQEHDNAFKYYLELDTRSE